MELIRSAPSTVPNGSQEGSILFYHLEAVIEIRDNERTAGMDRNAQRVLKLVEAVALTVPN